MSVKKNARSFIKTRVDLHNYKAPLLRAYWVRESWEGLRSNVLCVICGVSLWPCEVLPSSITESCCTRSRAHVWLCVPACFFCAASSELFSNRISVAPESNRKQATCQYLFVVHYYCTDTTEERSIFHLPSSIFLSSLTEHAAHSTPYP